MEDVRQLGDSAKGSAELKEERAAEKRRHRRVPTELSVHLYWKEESGDLVSAPGTVRDVSAEGFGIEFDRPFHVGSLISVATHAGSLQCVVRHVGENGGHWRIGVEVLAASDGSDHKRSLDNLAKVLAESGI